VPSSTRRTSGRSTQPVRKRTTQEWRDRVDLAEAEDFTIRQASADYRYIGIDTTHLEVAETVRMVKAAIPEIYGTPETWPG
jgi:hypothetical protein